MKGPRWMSLKSSASQFEPKSLWAAAKHDIALARLSGSNNASKSSFFSATGATTLYILAQAAQDTLWITEYLYNMYVVKLK